VEALGPDLNEEEHVVRGKAWSRPCLPPGTKRAPGGLLHLDSEGGRRGTFAPVMIPHEPSRGGATGFTAVARRVLRSLMALPIRVVAVVRSAARRSVDPSTGPVPPRDSGFARSVIGLAMALVANVAALLNVAALSWSSRFPERRTTPSGRPARPRSWIDPGVDPARWERRSSTGSLRRRSSWWPTRSSCWWTVAFRVRRSPPT
jgi:hypothetical protein